MGIFGDYYGTSVNPQDMRALSQDELQALAVRQMAGMQQAQYRMSYIQGLANYHPPQRPLDERFADFKVRLAAAIERNRLGKTEGTN